MLITEIIALICIVAGGVIIAGCLLLELWPRMVPLGGVLLIGGLLLTSTTQKTYTYTAVVKDFDGNQTTYTVKNYRTDGGLRAGATTMTLILEDGTKIVAPIQNVIITGQQKGE